MLFRSKILVALEKGERTSRELSGLSLKYTSRVSDLRQRGYRIKAARQPSGVFRYRPG